VAEARETAFDELLDPIGGLDNVLKEAKSTPRLEQPRLLFVRMRGEEPQVEALAELLTDQLVNYAIPLVKRRRANLAGASSTSGGDTAAHSRLQREARRLLIEYEAANAGRYGEIGELLSYVIAVQYLGAAQLGSKMALKTARGMPVHGVDGLHVRANDDGTVTFIVLESKLIPDATDASRDMVASISEYRASRNKQLNELRLVSDLSNLDALAGEHREEAKSYFSTYEGSGNHLMRRDWHVGTLVFSENAYQQRQTPGPSDPPTFHEDNFEALYAAKHNRFKTNLERQAKEMSLNLGTCTVILIAVPDVNELKRIFAGINQ